METKRLREFILRRSPDKDKVQGSFLHRLFGRRILSGDLWRLDARSLAGGVSLGVFIALTPTIPFHMVLACVGALVFRVNLPAALLACWVSNPVTAVPIYVLGWRLGRFVLESLPVIDTYLATYGEGGHGTIVISSVYLWTGSLLMAVPAALVSHLLVRWACREVRHAAHCSPQSDTTD